MKSGAWITASLLLTLCSTNVLAASSTSRCVAAKAVAVGTYTQCRMQAAAHFTSDANSARRTASLARCDAALGKRFSRAESTYGSACPTAGDRTLATGFVTEVATQATVYLTNGAPPLGAGFCGPHTTFNPASLQCLPTTICGNGVLDTNEDCDVDWKAGAVLLGGGSCSSEGFDAGTLRCGPGCVYDTTGCRHQTCGDGVADSPEQCDGLDLAGQTCSGLGFFGGTLVCSLSCQFDTSSCQSCGVALADNWNDGDAAGWNGWFGNEDVGSGVLHLVRTSTEWGSGSQLLAAPISGGLRLEVTMSLNAIVGQTDVCLVNSSTTGGISYVPSAQSPLFVVNGYCLILNNATDNGSLVGVQLVPGWQHTETGAGIPIIQSAFTPAANVAYRLAVTRTANGTWELFVNDVSVGTAIDLSTPTLDGISIVAGADGNVGAGGSFADLILTSCPTLL